MDKLELAKAKKEAHYEKLLQDCPPSFRDFIADVESLGFFDQPNYTQILTSMRKDMNNLKVSKEDPFEWEDPDYIF